MKSASQKDSRGITFAVHDVEPARDFLQEQTTSAGIQELLKDPRPLHACCGYLEKVVKETSDHPLIAACHLAFSQHRPLVLSPDILWIAIAQGFSQHVKLEKENLGNLFPGGKEKIQLTIQRDDMVPESSENRWEEIFEQLCQQIRGHLGEEIHQTLVCDFSTTGPVEKAVSHVVMMDAFQTCFDYVLVSVCGIPEITLEGTTEDWISLKEKVMALEKYDLSWWTKALLPLCDQLIRASRGDIDLEHWKNIYKLHEEYAVELINGWITTFFPYIVCGSHGEIIRNPLLEKEYSEEIPGLSSTNFSFGFSRVPFTWILHGLERPMEFIAGFVGVEQKKETLGLKPKLGWAVRDSGWLGQIMQKLKESHQTFSSVVFEEKDPQEMDGLSAEMIQFYKETNGAILFPEPKERAFCILPVEKREAVKLPRGTNEFLSFASWRKICLLPDGSCYAYAPVPGKTLWNWNWLFAHISMERPGEEGRIQMVATSFSELLEKILGSPEKAFHEVEGFEPCDVSEILKSLEKL